MEHSSDIAQVQEHVWKAYHSLSMALDLPCDPMKETVWMSRAAQNLNHRQCLTPPLDPLAVKDDKWWLALAPQQEDDAPVEGKGKEKATEQLMEVLKIKVLLIKKRKQSGKDGESEDGEEEAEGSRSVGMLIFELCKGSKLCCTAQDGSHTIVVAMSGKTVWWCTPAIQPMLTTPLMDPAIPAEMEEEGDEDPVAIMTTPSPPCKKAHHVWVRMPSPLTLAPGPVPSMSMSTSHLAPTGGSILTTALAAPPTLVQPCQPGTYVLVDTFQQVLVWEHMTQLEHEMAEMTSNMHCWWDDIITNYLELNQHVRTMEDIQHKFIRQPFMDVLQLFCEDLGTLEQRVMCHDLEIWLGISQLEQNTCCISHMAEVVHTVSRQHCDQGMQTWMDKAGSSGSHSTASDV
ncbi:hypothetical protein ID866_11208 [Astraeus odoratus]|nr:hypothetical protein ID866_11208 [Astraeus odoratus]